MSGELLQKNARFWAGTFLREDDLSNYGNCTCGKGRREREREKKINSARDCACSNEACARCTTVGKILEKSNSENWGRGGKKMHIYPGNRASARFFWKKKAAEDVDGALFHPTSFRFFSLSRWVGGVGTCRRNFPQKKRRRTQLEFRGDPQIDRKIPSLSLLPPPLPLLQSSSCFTLNKKRCSETKKSRNINPNSTKIHPLFFWQWIKFTEGKLLAKRLRIMFRKQNKNSFLWWIRYRKKGFYFKNTLNKTIHFPRKNEHFFAPPPPVKVGSEMGRRRTHFFA